MKEPLTAWLDAMSRRTDRVAAAHAAATAVTDPWRIVAEAGLLARCAVATAETDVGLTSTLAQRAPTARGVLAVAPAGSPIPVPDSPQRRCWGAYDTPAALALDLARATLAGVRNPEVLDPACGS